MSRSSREVQVDRSLCMGSGQCVWYAPQTFAQDESTIAIVIDQHGDPDETIETAVTSCPTGALSFVEPGTDDEATPDADS